MTTFKQLATTANLHEAAVEATEDVGNLEVGLVM